MWNLKIICVSAFLLLAAIACTKEEVPGKFDWLTGKWMQAMGNGILIEEWRKVDNDFYKGHSYAITGNDTTMLEQMELRSQDTTFFYAVELFKGKQDTFHLHVVTDSSAVFIDAANPFPKQILYKLQGANQLFIVLEGQRKGEPTMEEYRMVRVQEE